MGPGTGSGQREQGRGLAIPPFPLPPFSRRRGDKTQNPISPGSLALPRPPPAGPRAITTRCPPRYADLSVVARPASLRVSMIGRALEERGARREKTISRPASRFLRQAVPQKGRRSLSTAPVNAPGGVRKCDARARRGKETICYDVIYAFR